MSVQMKNNQLLSYLIILISLFILILFTKDQFINVQSNIEQVSQLNNELSKTRDTQEKLQKIALEVDQQDSVTTRYILSEEDSEMSLSEEDILDYFFSYADSIDASAGILTINNINISKVKENELWFYETSINVSALVSNEEVMKWFLDYLVAEDSKYRFFIQNYSYPFDEREGNFNIQLPLKIFYR